MQKSLTHMATDCFDRCDLSARVGEGLGGSTRHCMEMIRHCRMFLFLLVS